MPIYEYICTSCGEDFEIMVAMSERDACAVCPACGGRDVAQRFAAIAGKPRSKVNPGTFVRPGGGQKPYYRPGGPQKS